MPQTSPPPRPFFRQSQFYTSISDFLCHQKVRSFFSKHKTIIRFFDNKKKMPPLVTLNPHFLLKINKNQIYTWIWPFFLLEFSRFSPKLSIKIRVFFSKLKFTLVYRPFFYLKNDQKWTILAIFFILSYTDGFLGPRNMAILALFPIFWPWFVT